jgi:hypothetical protein
MKKSMGFLIIVLALVIGIVPLFTDCLANGRSLTTADGRSVPMKCHWTAIAEIGMAVPLGLVGVLSLTSKRKESFRMLSGFGGALGILTILFPTLLIGTCMNPDMPCNLLMKPILISAGVLVVAASLVVFGTSGMGMEQAAA